VSSSSNQEGGASAERTRFERWNRSRNEPSLEKTLRGFDLEESGLPLLEPGLVWCCTSGAGRGLTNVAGFGGGMGTITVAATAWFPTDELGSAVTRWGILRP
jgi:hypothetical protein